MATYKTNISGAMKISRILVAAGVPFVLNASSFSDCVVHCEKEEALTKAVGFLTVVSTPRHYQPTLSGTVDDLVVPTRMTVKKCPYKHSDRSVCPHCLHWERILKMHTLRENSLDGFDSDPSVVGE